MNKILIICGATATGKSGMALEIAKKKDSVIVNADALQVYRDVPIITAQPGRTSQGSVPHELYSIIPCDVDFSVGKWLELCVPFVRTLLSQGRLPVIVGGTGMYISSLVYGISQIPDISKQIKGEVVSLLKLKGPKLLYQELIKVDPQAESKIHPNDTQRILRALEVFYMTEKPLIGYWQKLPNKSFFEESQFCIIKLEQERHIIYRKCEDRLELMLQNGALKEIANYTAKYSDTGKCKAIGIREFQDYLQNRRTLDEALQEAKKQTRRYAKRQLLWFRSRIKSDYVVHNVDEEKELLKSLF